MPTLTHEVLNQFRQQVQQGNTRAAIDELLVFDSAYRNELILLSNRLNDLIQRNRIGIIDHAEYQLENNRINFSFLNILDEMARNVNYSPPSETPQTQERTLVYRTRQQKIYLVKTGQGLECHLEDDRPERTGHQWTISKSQAKDILADADISINPDYRERTGTYTLGQRRNWLYSKRLFPDPGYLKSLLTELLKDISL